MNYCSSKFMWFASILTLVAMCMCGDGKNHDRLHRGTGNHSMDGLCGMAPRLSANPIKAGLMKELDEEFELKFSKVIRVSKGRVYEVPIFRGTAQPVCENELTRYATMRNLSIFGSLRYAVMPERGARKTMTDILTFYKNNLLADVDINAPSSIYSESCGMEPRNDASRCLWAIDYDFLYKGKPSLFGIVVDGPTHKQFRKKYGGAYGSIASDKISFTNLYIFEKAKSIRVIITFGKSSCGKQRCRPKR